MSTFVSNIGELQKLLAQANKDTDLILVIGMDGEWTNKVSVEFASVLVHEKLGITLNEGEEETPSSEYGEIKNAFLIRQVSPYPTSNYPD